MSLSFHLDICNPRVVKDLPSSDKMKAAPPLLTATNSSYKRAAILSRRRLVHQCGAKSQRSCRLDRWGGGGCIKFRHLSAELPLTPLPVTAHSSLYVLPSIGDGGRSVTSLLSYGDSAVTSGDPANVTVHLHINNITVSPGELT